MPRRICSVFVALAVLMPAAAQAEVSDAFLDGFVPDFGNAAAMGTDLNATGGMALIYNPDSQEMLRLNLNTLADPLPLRAQLAEQPDDSDLTVPPMGDEFMPSGPRFSESWFEELADNLGGGLAMMQACGQDAGKVLGNMGEDLARQGVGNGQIEGFMSRMREVASQDLKEFQASADFARAKSEICAVPAAFGPSTMVMMAFRSAVDTPAQ